MNNDFLLPLKDLLDQIQCDPATGLTAQEAAARAERQGANVLTRVAPPSFLVRVRDAILEPMMLLLLGAAVIAVGVNVVRALSDAGGNVNFLECAGICAAILLSVAITLVMEGRSAKAFEILSRMSHDIRIRVVRDAQTVLRPAASLVVGDVVMLGPGDRVPADGRLLESDTLYVDESSLTGESVPAAKDASAVLAEARTPLAERRNMAYAGCFVTSGTGRLVVTTIGDRTELGRIARSLVHAGHEATPLQEKLARLGKRIAFWGTLAAVLAFALQVVAFARTDGITFLEVSDAFIQGILLVVAAVPEGLPTTAAIALSITVLRLARENALVRRMIACEAMGCVNVICSDKTGTLTENRMTVVAVVPARDPDAHLPPGGSSIFTNASINSTADVAFGSGGPKFIGNPTECALIVAAHAAGVDYRAVRKSAKVEKVIPFSSEAKTMTTVLGTGDGDLLSYVKGSPEIILARCSLDAATRGAAEADIASYQVRACRVIAFAHGRHALGSATPDGLVYDGFVAIADPLRPGVREAVRACRSAGIDIKILTGDNLVTAQAIARDLEILDHEHGAVEASTLESLPEQELARELPSIRVIARSTPLVKLRVVRALKAAGNVVAVTGDGVNDAPAVKSADVGIAMGITGTEVAKEASDIVLLDDSFATIVKAIKWGRGLYDNFRRFIQFQLTVNVSAVLVVLASVLFSALGLAETWGEPFTALELLWINIVMDGPPALTLGLEPIRDDLMARRPPRRDGGVISREMAVRVVVNGVFIASVFLLQQRLNFLGATPGAEQKSVLFTLFVVFQLFNAFNCRALAGQSAFRRFFGNRLMLAAFGLTFLLQVAITQYGRPFFGTVPLSLHLWVEILLIGSSILFVSEAVRLLSKLGSLKCRLAK